MSGAGAEERWLELLRRLRHIELGAREASEHLFAGAYHSAFKGRGISFSEVREYVPGDEVRIIDWNVTARMNSPYVKVFEEEREIALMLVVDARHTMRFGTRSVTKFWYGVEVAALIGFSAVHTNDRVGLYVVGSREPVRLPPAKGHNHFYTLLRRLVRVRSACVWEGLSDVLRHLWNLLTKRAIVVLISDFYFDDDYQNALRMLASRHEVVGVRVYDPAEEHPPFLGGTYVWDGADSRVRALDSGTAGRGAVSALYRWYVEQCREAFRRAVADLVELSTTDDYMRILYTFFRQRARHRTLLLKEEKSAV